MLWFPVLVVLLTVGPLMQTPCWAAEQHLATAAPPPTTAAAAHRLTLDTMSQSVRRMEYAVRGKVVLLADRISKALAQPSADDNPYPFDHIVYTNIGNPQLSQLCCLLISCRRVFCYTVECPSFPLPFTDPTILSTRLAHSFDTDPWVKSP